MLMLFPTNKELEIMLQKRPTERTQQIIAAAEAWISSDNSCPSSRSEQRIAEAVLLRTVALPRKQQQQQQAEKIFCSCSCVSSRRSSS